LWGADVAQLRTLAEQFGKTCRRSRGMDGGNRANPE
jgi:hypothetical protein